MLREFQYAGSVEKIRLVNLNVTEAIVDELFEKCSDLKVISVINKRRTDHFATNKFDDFDFRDLDRESY